MRADARRNHDQLLAAARDVFTEQGACEASLDHVAKRAGVGPGTLYRHFPTREDLLAAVYRDDVERIAARAGELATEHPPAEALAAWMRVHLDYVRQERGIGSAVKAMIGAENEAFEYCKVALRNAVGSLLEPAKQAGAVRTDVTPTDLLRLVHGIGVSCESAPHEADHLLEVVIEGLAPRD